jgi:murein DD-endopeptidase MepM/ murein hydrolase activator NlpD
MSKKEKYKFNADTLSYDKVERTWGEKVLKSLLIIAPAIILGFVFQFLFTSWFKSPNETALENDNIFLKLNLDGNSESLGVLESIVENMIKNDRELYRTILNAEPFTKNLGTGGTDNSEAYEQLKGYDFSSQLIENARRLKKLQKMIYAQSLSHEELIKLAKEKEKMLAHIPAIQPVANKDLKKAAGGYGWRDDPVYHTQRMHWGLDFTCNTGTPVYASGNGKVVLIEKKMWGYGKSVVIDHGYGYKTRYAHLSKFEVKLGQTVNRGEVIGQVGSTGKSTGPHLHYEVIKNGDKLNPINYFHNDLTPEEYEKMLEISSSSNVAFD